MNPSGNLIDTITPPSPNGYVPTTMNNADGTTVELESPAQSLVTLSPHLAELVFAAGAGDRLAATVEFSEYPPEAVSMLAQSKYPYYVHTNDNDGKMPLHPTKSGNGYHRPFELNWNGNAMGVITNPEAISTYKTDKSIFRSHLRIV